MLLITIVEELDRQLKQSESTTVLSYFFCQGTNQDLNNATAILRGLIYLLIEQRPVLISHLRASYDHAGSNFFQDANSFIALSKVLEGMLHDKSLTRAYLVIDALDECDVNQRQLLDLITKRAAASRVKWIISSRNKPEIEWFLTTDNSSTLGLEITGNAEQVSRAVGAYIDEKIRDLPSLQDYHDSNEIRDILHEKANGTFLWVSLVFEELRTANSWNIREIVQEMPPTLEDLYAQMIEQIQKLQRKDPELCRLVLSTITLAYRPLHLHELGVLSNLPKEISANMPAIRKLVAICGSFLTIQDDFIYVIHQSAQDYLSNKAAAMLFPAGHIDVYYRMFSRSLLIMQETLKRDIYGLHNIGVSINQIKGPEPDRLISVRYSCIYWISHFCEFYYTSDYQNQERLGKMVYNFLRQFYLYWLEALNLMQHIGDGVLSITRLRNIAKVSSLSI